MVIIFHTLDLCLYYLVLYLKVGLCDAPCASELWTWGWTNCLVQFLEQLWWVIISLPLNIAYCPRPVCSSQMTSDALFYQQSLQEMPFLCFINEQRISGLKFSLSWHPTWPLSDAICAPAIFVFFCLCTVFSLLPTESEGTGLIIFFSDWEVSFTSKKTKSLLAKALKANRAMQSIQRGQIK